MKYEVLYVLIPIAIGMIVLLGYLSYKRGEKNAREEGYKLGKNDGYNSVWQSLNKELLSLTNTGIYENSFTFTTNGTKVDDVYIICEVKEIFRTVDGKKSKVEYISIKDVYKKTGIDINTPHLRGTMPEYLDTRDIQWYTDPNDRKLKIQKFIEVNDS